MVRRLIFTKRHVRPVGGTADAVFPSLFLMRYDRSGHEHHYDYTRRGDENPNLAVTYATAHSLDEQSVQVSCNKHTQNNNGQQIIHCI